MKNISLLIITVLFSALIAKGQGMRGAAENKLTDSICHCMALVDQAKINSKQDAVNIFTSCFSKYPNLLLKTAEERKVKVTDPVAMREIGTQIGLNLMRQNCTAFTQLSSKMVRAETTDSHLSYGKLIRIDTKGLNYFVLTDAAGKEESFVWLHQFAGSAAFVNGLVGNAGKRVAIKWQETEIYIPTAKGYFGVKEITSLSIL